MAAGESTDTIYLIDGHAQIYRAYFAIRGGMSSPVTGEPTQAVFAFAGMLLKLLVEHKPHAVVMAIDLPGKTFRDEMYSEYKANREPPPDDFFPQEQRIFEMTRLFGIPIVGVEGAEADDVIATLTQRVLDDADHGDMQVRIVSRDKDLEQLLTPRVCMFDIHKDETIDVARLEEEKGIRPDQVVDVLALMGDKVDNIPGVEGVGPKTAAKLISEFGSVTGVLANIDKIKGKRGQNIAAAADRLPLNLRLVELKRDVEMDFDLADAQIGAIDATALRQFFQALGFRRHIRDLDELVKPADTDPPAAQPGSDDLFPESLYGDDGEPADPEQVPAGFTTAESYDYRAITTRKALDELFNDLCAAPLVSVDTETIGLGRRVRLCGLSFSWRTGAGVYVPIVSPYPDRHLDERTVLDVLRSVLEDETVSKCGHNLKYDVHVLRHAGINLRGVAFDSMIACQLLGYASRGLDHMAETLLQHKMAPISRLIGQRGSEQATMDQIPLDQITPYAAEDADITLRLYEKLSPMLAEKGMAALAAVEMPLVEVLADMECNGIRIDPDELLRQKNDLAGRIDVLRGQIFEAAGGEFNLDSPKQLAEVLFKKLGLPTGKRTKTGASTDAEVLEKLAKREDLTPQQTLVPRLIVEYRRFAKLVNTYLGRLHSSVYKDDGRIHASFQQLGAATGRLSSGAPNLQNIPVRTEVGRQIRKAFVAEPGHLLICADYSQIELRILAHLSQDPGLTEAFNNDRDIHAAVAAQVYSVALDKVTVAQRNAAKVINFGIIYGVTPYGLARRIDGLDETGAKVLIADYRKRFSGIDRFMHHCVDEALETGGVRTMLGRRRQIPQIQSRSPATRSLGERLAINTVVQGSATGDLIKTAMVNLYRRIHRDRLPMKMLVQIHDELLLESPRGAAKDQAEIVREEMESAMKLSVPLKVDIGIGPDWLSAK